MKTKIRKWEVCVEWTMLGFVELEAQNEEEAMARAVELVENNAIEIKDIEDKDEIIACYANERKP